MLRESLLLAVIASASAFSPAGYVPSVRSSGAMHTTCQLRPGDSPSPLAARPLGGASRSGLPPLRMSADDQGPLGKASDNELVPVRNPPFFSGSGARECMLFAAEEARRKGGREQRPGLRGERQDGEGLVNQGREP